MKRNLILILSVFLAIPGLSDERIDDLVECSALYTFLSLAGPIMSTKTRLLYDAADFWIEAEITNAEQNNFEMSKKSMDGVANNKNKLLKDFATFYDNGSLFKLQRDISLECGTPLPAEYTSEDINCIQSSMEKVSEYLESSGINSKIQECESLSQTFIHTKVREEVVKSFRK